MQRTDMADDDQNRIATDPYIDGDETQSPTGSDPHLRVEQDNSRTERFQSEIERTSERETKTQIGY